MSLSSAAKKLAAALHEHRLRVVFAESCTAGLVAASLARVPGISQWHCGSAVTYRNETKIEWLGVSPRTIARHTEVSEQVARQMAVGVLNNTSEADISASITGHLGPHAPDGLDGVVYVGVARRVKSKSKAIAVERVVLEQTTRLSRQRESAELVLTILSSQLVGLRFD